MESRFDRGVENEKKAVMYFVPDILDDKRYFTFAYKRGRFCENPRFFYLFPSAGKERGSNTRSGIQENKHLPIVNDI